MTKGASSIIIVILILVLSIGITAGAAIWFGGAAETLKETTETKVDMETGAGDIRLTIKSVDIDSGSVTIENSGLRETNTSTVAVYVNNELVGTGPSDIIVPGESIEVDISEVPVKCNYLRIVGEGGTTDTIRYGDDGSCTAVICAQDSHCGSVSYGSWSACSQTACGVSGTRTRSVTTPTCREPGLSSSYCENVVTTESGACTGDACSAGESCVDGSCIDEEESADDDGDLTLPFLEDFEDGDLSDWRNTVLSRGGVWEATKSSKYNGVYGGRIAKTESGNQHHAGPGGYVTYSDSPYIYFNNPDMNISYNYKLVDTGDFYGTALEIMVFDADGGHYTACYEDDTDHHGWSGSCDREEINPSGVWRYDEYSILNAYQSKYGRDPSSPVYVRVYTYEDQGTSEAYIDDIRIDSNYLIIRDDDGTAEQSTSLDFGDDQSTKRLIIPTGARNDATKATLWIYGISYGCSAPSNSHRLTVNGGTQVNLNPCTIWSESSYEWKAIDISLSRLQDGTNSFVIKDTNSHWTESNLRVGVDSDNDYGRTDTYYNGNSQAGELMWYLVIEY